MNKKTYSCSEMIGMDFSLGKTKRSWNAFMQVMTFELRCEGALEVKKRETRLFLRGYSMNKGKNIQLE